MNPNKKTLNPQNNSPWLLCPSKSFPGKFYYFNGSTGETAWSITEPDNKNPKKTICKVTDKTNTYPEPFGHPADESTNTTNSSSFLKKSDLANSTDFSSRSNIKPCSTSMLCNKGTFCNGVNCSNRNSFSSGSCNEPKYTFGSNLRNGINLRCGTNLCHHKNSCDNLNYRTNMNHGRDSAHLNYKSMGTQFHSAHSASPTFGQAVFPRYATNDLTTKVIWTLTPMLIPEKVMPSQMTQYDLQHEFQTLPLVQFESLKVNAQENPFRFKTFQTSSPIIKHLEAETQTVDQKSTKDDASQLFIPTRRIRTQSETDITPKFTLKPSKSVQYLDDIQNETLKAQCEIDNDNTKLTALDKNDLRFKLVAKRRMSVAVDSLESNKDNARARLPNQLLNKVTASKKRVTFDLRNYTNPDVQEHEIQSPGSVHSDSLESMKPKQYSIWYITVDTPVLLTELECVEQFVKSDKNCRLLIPYTVKSELGSLSRGDCNGRQNIFTARQIVRKLATPAPHIVVQRKRENNTDEVGVLDCCWQLLQEHCHVILITNNRNLSSKAEKIGLECHSTDEIKEVLIPATPQPESDLKKVEITFNNSEKRPENLFQQSISELNSLHLPQAEFPVHCVRKSLFDNQHSENTNVFSNKDMNDKLINITNTSKALKNISYAGVDDINLDIQRLDISDNNANDNVPNNSELINDIQYWGEMVQLKNDKNFKDTIKVSGITKLSSSFDIDDELKRYEVKDAEMENRIKSRRDEWVCRLTQTMEGVLTDILLQENVRPKKILPPWSLHEAIQILGDKFKSLPNIKTITTQFTMHLFNCSSNVGKLNKDIHPTEFIKLVGFSNILIHNLKETFDYIELNEADDLLCELMRHIEDPNTDIDLSLDKVITSILNRSDIEFETKIPQGKKNKSDVLEYLKIHFPSREAYEIEKPEPKVVRTVGKDLNTLKINHTKTITLDKDQNLPLEEVKDTAVSEPKVMRNVKVIGRTLSDLNDLDYEETLSTISLENERINDKSDEAEFDVETKVGTIDGRNSNSEDPVKEVSLCSDFNECIHAYPLMKAFLGRLKRTFILIYNFINKSVEDYQRDELSDDKRSDINLKINMAHKYILKLVERLKSIIARESSEGTTLKDLLIQAGDYVEEDQSMAGYRHVVIKYLEQAQVLEEALTLMLTIVNEKTERETTSNGIAYHGTFTTVADQSAPSDRNLGIEMATQVLYR